MKSLVTEILEANLKSQLAIEEAILPELTRFPKTDSSFSVAILISACKIAEIRRQLKQLDLMERENNGGSVMD